MNKKIEEIAESISLELEKVTNKSVESISEVDEYTLVQENILQPELLTNTLNPMIIKKEEDFIFTFDGRTLFFDQTYKNTYIFLPYAITNGYFYNCKKAPHLLFVFLDTQNKLQYCKFTDNTFEMSKITISRNVVQMVKYKNEIYYLSYKKDSYFLNTLSEDKDGIKPKVILHNIVSKTDLKIFCADGHPYLLQDHKLISTSGVPLVLNESKSGIYDLQGFIVTFDATTENIILNMYDAKFILKDNLIIKDVNYNLITKSFENLICIKNGDAFYIILEENEKLKIAKTLTISEDILDFFAILRNKKIILHKLISSSKTKGKKIETFITENNYPELPIPKADSKVYDPTEPHNIDEKLINRLFSEFELKLEQREVEEKQRQFNLLDKISETLNSTLTTVMEKIIKNEINLVEKNLTKLISAKIDASNKEDKIMDFIKEIICETLLPVVEASMDEIRLQLVSEISSFKDSNYLKDVGEALEDLKLKENKDNEISRLLKNNQIENAVKIVNSGSKFHIKEFIKYLDPETLEYVSSNYLVELLSKCILFFDDKQGKEFESILYNTLLHIELETLDVEYLKLLSNYLKELKENSLILKYCTKNILMLTDFIDKKIVKIFSKRGVH